jgi:uncharacterized membrane protein
LNSPDPDSVKQPFQEELLAVPDPSPFPEQQAGTVNAQFNYNVNLPTVQLPSADEFAKYPPEVREFLMRAGEQDARHAWIMKEQEHRHSYDQKRLSGTFDRQRTAQLFAGSLSLFCIAAGTVVIIAQGNPWGFAAILAGITPLVAMAAYAKNVAAPHVGDNVDPSRDEGEKPDGKH